MRIAHGKYTAFKGERADCGVRSLAIAADVSYAQAYDALARAGRKPRCWSYVSQLALALVSLSRNHRTTMYTRGGGAYAGVITQQFTLKQWLAQHRTGRFIVRRNGHFFAVIDGIVHDHANARTSARHRVKDAIEIL